MSYKIALEHLIEPVTLSEAKANMRVDFTDEDDFISDLIAGARGYIERVLGISLIQKHYDYFSDSFPLYDTQAIQLPVSPLDTVEFVKYTDTNDAEQTWSSSLYVVDNVPQLGLIYPDIDQVYPIARKFPKSVNVRFVTGPAQQGQGLAESGSGTTIRLAASDTNADDFYNGMPFLITAGTGQGQHGRITDYDSTTKDATLADTLGTALDTSSQYTILKATPSPLIRAILLLCGHWYENREDMITGTITSKIELGVRSLIAPYKVFSGI